MAPAGALTGVVAVTFSGVGAWATGAWAASEVPPAGATTGVEDVTDSGVGGVAVIGVESWGLGS